MAPVRWCGHAPGFFFFFFFFLAFSFFLFPRLPFLLFFFGVLLSFFVYLVFFFVFFLFFSLRFDYGTSTLKALPEKLGLVPARGHARQFSSGYNGDRWWGWLGISKPSGSRTHSRAHLRSVRPIKGTILLRPRMEPRRAVGSTESGNAAFDAPARNRTVTSVVLFGGPHTGITVHRPSPSRPKVRANRGRFQRPDFVPMRNRDPEHQLDARPALSLRSSIYQRPSRGQDQLASRSA